MNGCIGLLNRQTFEWNANDFCRLFSKTQTAQDFFTVFNANTNWDSSAKRLCAMPSDDNVDSETSMEDDDSQSSPSLATSRKRSLEEREECEVVSKHLNPLDDEILSKRVGKLIAYPIIPDSNLE